MLMAVLPDDFTNIYIYIYVYLHKYMRQTPNLARACDRHALNTQLKCHT